jgi:transposase
MRRCAISSEPEKLRRKISCARVIAWANVLLLHGRRPATTMNAWTQRHLTWVKTVHFAHAAQDVTLLDYLNEVEHMADRLERLERAIDDAVTAAPEQMRAVIEALQALRGIAQVSAVTIVAEVGTLSRFARPRQLMGYSGAVPSEDTSPERTRRGGITKTGNAHLRLYAVLSFTSSRTRRCSSYPRERSARPLY